MATKPPTKRKTTTLKKVCGKVIRREGVKANGQLKKGYRWKKGSTGVAVKAAANTAARKTAARKPATKKPASKKVSEGINKTTGKLKKGYKYSGGRVVKVKPVAKKK